MMPCRKCKAALPDGARFCPMCGVKVGAQQRHRRGNGLGTAYRRGNTWTAAIVVGWKQLQVEEGGLPKLTPVRITKGGFRTKREALEHCVLLRKNTLREDRSAPPLHDYWETYSTGRLEKLGASKQSAYRTAWKKLKPLYWIPVDRIGVSDMQTVVNSVAPTYYPAKDCRTVLTRLFEMAAAEGWCSKDLPSFVELPALNEKERQTFTDIEQAGLWKLYEAGDARAAIPLVMICTGMMPGEMQALKVEHIDLAAQKITGVGMKTKVRRAAPIYLPDDVLPIMEDLIASAQPSGYIWPHNEEKWYHNYYAALEAAKCRRLEPYSCRHTTATRLAVTEGIAPQIVRRVMRWSTARMLDRYAHPDDADALAAANAIKKPKKPEDE